MFHPLTEEARPPAHRPVVYTQEVVFPVGTWLSLVEHSLGVRGVGSSNLPVPTIKIIHLQDYPACIVSPLQEGRWDSASRQASPSLLGGLGFRPIQPGDVVEVRSIRFAGIFRKNARFHFRGYRAA
jgi:hypothetical protein